MSPNSSVYLGKYQVIICVPVYRRVPLGYGCKQLVKEAIIWVAANRCVPLGLAVNSQCKSFLRLGNSCLSLWATGLTLDID